MYIHAFPLNSHSAFSRAKKQYTNGRGSPSSFVASFGQNKARAVGLTASGVKKREAKKVRT